MKYKYTKLVTVAGSILAIGSAPAAIWDGGGADNEFSTALNWDDDLAPASGTTQDIDTAVTVERSVDSVAGRTFISDGATVNIPSGTHSDNTSGSGIRNFLGRGSAGTINQSGGDYNIGHMLSIGGGGANGDGVYNLTGGTLNLSRGANSIIDASNPHGRPSLEVSDEENAGSGLFEISGGELITRFAAGIGSTGTFSVVGSGPTSINIGNNVNGGGDWLQQAGGTIKATIDLGGLTPININDLNGAGGVLAQFDVGSILDLGFASGVTPFEGTWTVLQAEGADLTGFDPIDAAGIGLAAGDAAEGWSFAIDNSGDNGLLTATFTIIPEPSTSLLAGSALLLGLGFRRRKA